MMGYEIDRPTSMNSGVIRVLVLPCNPGKGWESERLATSTLPHPGELLVKESWNEPTPILVNGRRN